MNDKKIFIWEIGDEENLFYNIGTWPSKASVRLDWSLSKWYIDKDMWGGGRVCVSVCFQEQVFLNGLKLLQGPMKNFSLIQKLN